MLSKASFSTLLTLFICAQISEAQTDSIYFTEPIPLNLMEGAQYDIAAPLLSSDGKTLYFTVTDKDEFSRTGELFHEIWSSEIINGIISSPRKAPAPFNNELNSAVIGTSNNGNTVYLFNTYDTSFPDLRGISMIEKQNGKWSSPKPIRIPGLNVKGGFYGFYVHSSEKVILVSVPTNDQEDLYFTRYSVRGQSWTRLQKLPDLINTQAFETSPFLNHDQSTLYFSREGKDGTANIYYSKKLKGDFTEWSKPKMLPSPPNAAASFNAYFSIQADNTVLFSNNKTGQSTIYLSQLEHVEISKSSQETDYNSTIPEVTEVKSIPEIAFKMEEKGRHLLFYDFDKFEVKSHHFDQLDFVVAQMNEYPNLKVDLNGHADYIASEEYNHGLSDRRAIGVAQYLLNKGIDKSRINVMAYGESLPISNNDTPKGRRLNRRVEIVLFQ